MKLIQQKKSRKQRRRKQTRRARVKRRLASLERHRLRRQKKFYNSDGGSNEVSLAPSWLGSIFRNKEARHRRETLKRRQEKDRERRQRVQVKVSSEEEACRELQEKGQANQSEQPVEGPAQEQRAVSMNGKLPASSVSGVEKTERLSVGGPGVLRRVWVAISSFLHGFLGRSSAGNERDGD
jgi:hypothetical protein